MAEEITHKDNITGNILTNKITHEDNITGKILTNKITHEDNIQGFEEFDYITDFYLPIKDVEEKYSSPTLALMRENEIDSHEFLGLSKVEGAGPVVKIKDKKELEIAKADASQAIIDFLKDSFPAAEIATKEAGANIANNLVQLFGFGSNRLFKGTKSDNISQYTTEFAQGFNKSTEDYIATLEKYAKENDINGVSKLLSDLGIDVAAMIPIQKRLKKTGLPSYVATPLSFGLAYGFTSGDKEFEEGTFSGKDGGAIGKFFIDSEVIHGVYDVLEALPATPESEVKELVSNTFDGTVWGGFGEGLGKVFKVLKNNVPALMKKVKKGELVSDIAKGTAATGVLAKSAYDTLNPNEQVKAPPIPEPINPNEKPTIDVSDPKVMKMGASSEIGKGLFKLAQEGGKRIIAGISRQKKKIPSTAEQQELAIPIIKTFDDDAKVLTYKVDDSVGKFADNLERNLDVEALVKNDFDKNKIINTAVQQAKKFDQESVFVSEQVVKRTPQSNVAFSVKFSTPQLFGETIDLTKQLERITGLQGYSFRTKILNLGDLPIANPKFKPKKRIYHNAIKNNGTTDDIREAGFIGLDGKMIDGGQGSGVRIMEHRDMATLAYKDFIAIEDKNSFRHMYKFMEETGSIRVSSNGPRLYAEVYQKPTLSQLKTLVKNYNEGGYEFITIDAVVPSKNLFSGIATDRANVQNVFTSDTRVNVAELSKFLDFQAVKGKRFIGIDTMNIPQYSKITDEAFIKKLAKIESNLSNTFGTKDISKPKLEYYINNVINKEDYGKYK